MGIKLRMAAPSAADKTQPERESSHRYSMASSQSLTKLQSTNKELLAIEARVAEIGRAVPHAPLSDLAELRTEAAQLESKAKRIECKGVDDVYTSDLNSGKQVAKD